MVAIKQAGGEFVDVPTIMLRIGRAGLETEESTIGVLAKRMEQRGYLFRTDQKWRPRGEPFVFYSLTEAGVAWIEHWTTKLKELL
jgi:DNA-binding PadR family transcriptional regulator